MKISFDAFIAGVILLYGKADKESQTLFFEALKSKGEYQIVGHKILFFNEFIDENNGEFTIKDGYTLDSDVTTTPGVVFSLKRRLEVYAYGPVLDLVKELKPEEEKKEEEKVDPTPEFTSFNSDSKPVMRFTELPKFPEQNWFVLHHLLHSFSGKPLLICHPNYIFAKAPLEKGTLEIEYPDWGNITPERIYQGSVRYYDQFSANELFLALGREVKNILAKGQVRKAARYLAIVEKDPIGKTYFVRAIIKAEKDPTTRITFSFLLNPEFEDRVLEAERSATIGEVLAYRPKK